MTKKQRIWLWIFIAMFAVPEILFFTTPMMILALSGKSFSKLSSLFVNYQVFLTLPIYLLIIIAIEWIAILSLLLMNIKLNKKIFVTLLLIILLWLSFVFMLVYVTGYGMWS